MFTFVSLSTLVLFWCRLFCSPAAGPAKRQRQRKRSSSEPAQRVWVTPTPNFAAKFLPAFSPMRERISIEHQRARRGAGKESPHAGVNKRRKFRIGNSSKIRSFSCAGYCQLYYDIFSLFDWLDWNAIRSHICESYWVYSSGSKLKTQIIMTLQPQITILQTEEGSVVVVVHQRSTNLCGTSFTTESNLWKKLLPIISRMEDLLQRNF